MCGRCKKPAHEFMDSVVELCDKMETVRGFCYLGDRVNASCGCEAAATASARIGWVKFRECGELLNSKRFSLKLKGMTYLSCVRSAMLYGSETWCLRENELWLSNLFSMRAMRVTRKQRKVKSLSTSSLTYLHSFVKPFLFLCKVFTTFKSIRVAQWVSEVAFFPSGCEIIRQTTDFFDTLYLRRDFKIHCCFLKCLVESFSKWSCSEINACKVWFKDKSNGVNNRSEEQKQAEMPVPLFKQRKDV